MVYCHRRQNFGARAQRTENPPLPRACLFRLNVQAALHRQCSLHKYRLLFCGLYPIVQILPENSFYFMAHLLSPSARRAWVEITKTAVNTLKKSVALLAEGVGRNRALWLDLLEPAGSPSSRRAWVEILMILADPLYGRSPSARRAWVEIAR